MFFISICFGPIRFYGQSYAPTDAVAKAKSHSNFIQRRTDGYSKVRANGDTKTYDGSLRGNRHSAFVHPPVKKPAFVRNGSLLSLLRTSIGGQQSYCSKIFVKCKRKATSNKADMPKNEIRLEQAMPCGTLSANRAIFSEEKTARFLLVGENPKIPHNAPLVRLRILRPLLFFTHRSCTFSLLVSSGSTPRIRSTLALTVSSSFISFCTL